MKHVKGSGQHRAQPARRRAAPAGKRRADVRPRYGRIAVFTASAVVTGVAVLGGFGLLPSGPEGASAASGALTSGAKDAREQGSGNVGRTAGAERQADRKAVLQTRTGERRSTPSSPPTAPSATPTTAGSTSDAGAPALPADSGAGRRVVFSESQQRVWLVDLSGNVTRTYLVSGSATDNLDPGTYEVYSRSRHAVGVDDSGTMEYFVRFTQGDAGGAIGFHTIPVDDGEPVQTVAQLGTPLSHGCVRQKLADAVVLWDFAPIGTTVVVTV